MAAALRQRATSRSHTRNDDDSCLQAQREARHQEHARRLGGARQRARGTAVLAAALARALCRCAAVPGCEIRASQRATPLSRADHAREP